MIRTKTTGDAMNIENLRVKHMAFGEGVVCSMNGKYITVKFENTQKIFVYPDIFEKFLTLEDGTVSDEIKVDLEKSKSQKQKILDMKREENLRAMNKGIVVPGREIVPGEADEEEGRQKSTELEDL